MRELQTSGHPQNTRNLTAINPVKRGGDIAEVIEFTEVHEPETFPIAEIVVKGAINAFDKTLEVSGMVVVESIKMVGTITVGAMMMVGQIATAVLLEWAKPRKGQTGDDDVDWDKRPTAMSSDFGQINITINQINNHG